MTITITENKMLVRIVGSVVIDCALPDFTSSFQLAIPLYRQGVVHWPSTTVDLRNKA